MTDDVKRLYRSRKERMLVGVCGGMADYFRLDPTLMRLIWIVATFILPFMILIYLIMWIVVPQEPEAASPAVEEAKE